MNIRNAAFLFLASIVATGAVPTVSVLAEDAVEVPLKIQNHRFLPAVVNVPAGKNIRLVVTNADKTPEEFESKSLRIERVIPGGKTAVFNVRPLEEGKRYSFVGEFHPATAKGELVAK